jgi:hypothetical protein
VNGGVVGKANVPTLFKATGVWTLRDAQLARTQGIWPPPSISVRDSSNVSYAVPLVITDAFGNNYVVSSTVLSSNGTAYTV